MKCSFKLIHACGAALWAVMFMLIVGLSPVQAQIPTPTTPPIKDSKDSAKDFAKASENQNAKEPSRDSAKDTAKKTANDSKDSAKDSAKDTRDAAKDSARDTRDSGANQSPARDYGDRNDANARRDAQKRDSRDTNGDRSTFRASDMRSADVGVWFDRSARDGLVISDVSSKGAIAKFGFQEGDQIVSVNGHRVNREGDFIRYLFGDDVRDSRIKVIVMRDGAEKVVFVEPAALMDDYRYVENDPLENFGIVVDDRYDDRIVVWKVIPQSPAYYAGIRAGDVFTTFHGRPVATRQDFVKVVTNLDEGSVPVQVRRGARVRDLTVDVPRFEARSERRMAMRPNYDSQQTGDNSRTDERQENRAEKRAGDRPAILPRAR